jgi:hypothetical protein
VDGAKEIKISIILCETNKPYIIDSLTQPLPLRHHWIFNAQMLDFVLNEIMYLEETVGPTVTLIVGDAEVRVPGAWNILVVDMETYTVDAIPVTACAAFEHQAFVFSPTDSKMIVEPIRIASLEPSGSCIYPALEKAQALVHAISPGVSHGKITTRGIIVGPADLWRWISNKTVGDILG